MSRRLRFVRFVLVGAVGFVVDASLTVLFSQADGVHALAARVPAFLAACAVTYSFNRRWTFQSDLGNWWSGWLHYLAVTGIGALLNYLTYALTLALIGSTSAKATVAGIAFGSIVGLAFNFTLSDRVVFRRQR